MTVKKKLMQLMKRQERLPLQKDYKALLQKYTKLVYTWINPINDIIYFQKNGDPNGKMTAAGMKKLHEMNTYLTDICEVREYIVATTSMLVFIGFNYPVDTALKQFKELYDVYEGALLDNMVILQGYKKAIINHRAFSIKKYKKPITMREVEKLNCWPWKPTMFSFFHHGCKVLEIHLERLNSENQK